MEQLKDYQDSLRKIRKSIVEAKNGIILMAKDLCENKLRFGNEIDREKGASILNMLTDVLVKESEFNLHERVCASATNQFQSFRDINTDKEDKTANIDGYIRDLKIREWIQNRLEAAVQTDHFDPKEDVSYKTVCDLLEIDCGNKDSENTGADDEVMEVDKAFTIPTDPITTKRITNPMKNTKCKHIFDKEGLEGFFKGKQQIQCPVAGCPQDNLLKTDFYTDEKLKILIELENEKQQNK